MPPEEDVPDERDELKEEPMESLNEPRLVKVDEDWYQLTLLLKSLLKLPRRSSGWGARTALSIWCEAPLRPHPSGN